MAGSEESTVLVVFARSRRFDGSMARMIRFVEPVKSGVVEKGGLRTTNH